MAQRVAFRKIFAEAFVISTRSMNPTLLPGDRFLVDKMWYRFAAPKHGDVVAFYTTGPKPEIHGHRIIGLPGDVIEIREEKLYLNGELQEEPYACFEGERVQGPYFDKLCNLGLATIPEGYFFEMGDNRRRSVDSRLKGCIPLQNIVGKVQIIYWSDGPEKPEAEPDRRHVPPLPPKETPQRIRWERIGLRLDR